SFASFDSCFKSGSFSIPLSNVYLVFLSRGLSNYQERYQITSSHGWDSIILFFSADEKDALDKFFKLLEEFFNLDKIAEDKDN
ncbi:MAG: hypothetical protein EAZ19_10330, partial [Oscillatoriales cyanobacterium]